MKIGMTLPSMVPGLGREDLLAWCRGIDAGPFASLACGERITFHNAEMRVLLAAAAAVTERVRIVPTLYVLPLHPAALVAKEVATLDVLSAGRVTLTVGVGGREHDYRAAEARFQGRFGRLEEQVRTLRRLWAGEPPFEGADPVGPSPVQPGGPPLWSGALGPKSLRRSAEWADGIAGFTMAGDPAEAEQAFAAAREAWRVAGRDEAPTLTTSLWYALGPDGGDRLAQYAYDYLEVFGDDAARPLAQLPRVSSEERLRDVVRGIRDAGCDELILVPTTADPAELDRTIDVLGGA